MNEFETALYSRLTGTAGLTALLASSTSVFNHIAKANAALDYVVFSLNAGGPANQTPRRAEELIYLVKGVSSVGSLKAGQIDDQIDTALHDQLLTVPGWTNYWLMRMSRVRYVEVTQAGKTVHHAGGLYRARLGK